MDLLFLDEERGAAILLPAALVVLRAHGPLLTVADEGDAAGLHALTDEVVHRRARATITQAEVVFVGTTFVAVTFDEHELIAVLLQPLGVRVEDPSVARANLVPIEIEIDGLQRVDGDELLHRLTRGLL